MTENARHLFVFLPVLFSDSVYYYTWRVSEWLLFNAKWSIFFRYIVPRASYIRWDNVDVRFVLGQHRG